LLYEFLIDHRAELIERCRTKVAARRMPKQSGAKLNYGVPFFLEQLVDSLRGPTSGARLANAALVTGLDGQAASSSAIGAAAGKHGLELLKQGFTIDQVVNDYGDLCQSITEMAAELEVQVQVEEFQTLNLCLDDAIAGAVTEFSYGSEALRDVKGLQSLNERLGFLAHELRNLLHVGSLAFGAIKAGRVAATGATSAVVDRSFIGLRNLIDRTLAEVRLSSEMRPQISPICVADLIAQIKMSSIFEAQARECKFTVAAVDPDLVVHADRELLQSAISNLLQNAFKYTKAHTEVGLTVNGSAHRVRIEIADQCGGLPVGLVDTMFLPFTQGDADKSGLGLGLAICQRAVEANGGILSVRNQPGDGCIFEVDLPRYHTAPSNV
jgi:signal transduction histidine kinase